MNGLGRQLLTKERTLGRSGIKVKEIGFGGWAIGGRHYGHIEKSQGADCVRAHLDVGGDFIDTVRWYDRSEEIIGEVLKERNARDRVVLSTKLRNEGKSEEIPKVREDLELSLRALQTDYVDLCIFHTPPPK